MEKVSQFLRRKHPMIQFFHKLFGIGNMLLRLFVSFFSFSNSKVSDAVSVDLQIYHHDILGYKHKRLLYYCISEPIRI